MTLVGRAIRRARTAAGYETRSVINQLAERDPRWATFCRAVEYVDYEAIPGAIVEFGVFTGMSLALLARAHSFDEKGMARRVAGFDSFRRTLNASCAAAWISRLATDGTFASRSLSILNSDACAAFELPAISSSMSIT